MRRITATSVVDQVTVEIQRSIVAGVLRPGQELSLRELADRLGVSTNPVREALRRMEGQGLLDLSSGRSVRVAPLDQADLAAIYRVRRRLEPEIARRSCLLLGDAELDELEELAVSFGDERMPVDAAYDAHQEFHTRL